MRCCKTCYKKTKLVPNHQSVVNCTCHFTSCDKRVQILQWWPVANEHKKEAHFVPENGIQGRIHIFEVKAHSSGNHMNVSDHVYIVHCSHYIHSKQVTSKAAWRAIMFLILFATAYWNKLQYELKRCSTVALFNFLSEKVRLFVIRQLATLLETFWQNNGQPIVAILGLTKRQ
jgi:hypothetical protein